MLQLKNQLQLFLAAAGVTSPACERDHFYGNTDKSKPVQVFDTAPRITAFVTNVVVKGVHWTAQTLFRMS